MSPCGQSAGQRSSHYLAEADGMSILERPALREYAATCNDPSGFEVRKHVHEVPAKTRHPDDCEATQTGSVGGWKGARQLPPDRISVAFLRATERRGSFVMGATRCPRGSSSTRADLIEITSPAPRGARRRGRHGAHRAMHEASCLAEIRRWSLAGHAGGACKSPPDSSDLSTNASPSSVAPHR